MRLELLRSNMADHHGYNRNTLTLQVVSEVHGDSHVGTVVNRALVVTVVGPRSILTCSPLFKT